MLVGLANTWLDPLPPESTHPYRNTTMRGGGVSLKLNSGPTRTPNRFRDFFLSEVGTDNPPLFRWEAVATKRGPTGTRTTDLHLTARLSPRS